MRDGFMLLVKCCIALGSSSYLQHIFPNFHRNIRSHLLRLKNCFRLDFPLAGTILDAFFLRLYIANSCDTAGTRSCPA